MKVKISIDKTGQFMNAPRKHGVIYTAGYLVRDPYEGWNYIVDYPELFEHDYETLYPVYWEKEEDVVKAAAA